MPAESEKVKITGIILQVEGQRIVCEPAHAFFVNPNSEPWPDHWTIVYNVYEGNDLVISG